MDIETLNSRFSHAGYVTFKEGPNGFPVALITTPHATAAITPYGAHLLSYRLNSDPSDLLFLSSKAVFKVGSPIRGGVPICWPWFGPDPEKRGRPDHGLARTRMWTVLSSDLLPGQEYSLAFELTDTPETYALWPHRFRLVLKLTVGKTLTLELTTENRGDIPFTLTQALHTYFAVGGIAQASITGLEGCSYTDKTDGGRIKHQEGPIRITAETDRIYPFDGGELILHDEALGRKIRIASEGSHTAVVWNPWVRVCGQKADLDKDDYQKTVCIETANAGEEIIVLHPRQIYSLKTVYFIT